MRGERPKMSALEGLKVSADLILVSLLRHVSQKGWGLMLPIFGVSQPSTCASQADSIFVEGITKLMPALTPPPQTYQEGDSQQVDIVLGGVPPCE